MSLDKIVRRNAQRFTHKTAFSFEQQNYSWGEFDARVSQLANGFRDAGLQVGDQVAVLLQNCTEFFEIYFACARSGVVAVPLNFKLSAEEIQTILEQSPPSIMICGGDFLPIVTELKGLLPGISSYYYVGKIWVGSNDDAGSMTYETLLSNDSIWHEPEVKDDAPLAIFYTSGTTGLPKGALVSSLNLEMNGYNQMIADCSVADDINLVATPVYHMGAVFMAVTYLMLGCTQVILPAFTSRAWLDTLQASGASVSLLIPTMINSILYDDNLEQADLSSLRLMFYGGGPMPPAVLTRAIDKLGCGFTQGYGLTETLEATFLTMQDHVIDGSEQQLKRLGSAGREAIGADIRIVDDESNDLPEGEIGEILISSRSVISGYFQKPEETAKAIRDGWFYTGDLGYLDEDRYLFMVDRKKDMVVSGGVNIYTKEIEELLYRHSDVVEAAIIALPDDHWGEVVAAVIVKIEQSGLDEVAIRDYCKESLASFKTPKRVFFVDELPKNPSGKILKRELREMFA